MYWACWGALYDRSHVIPQALRVDQHIEARRALNNHHSMTPFPTMNDLLFRLDDLLIFRPCLP